jgi:hypothetical protein
MARRSAGNKPRDVLTFGGGRERAGRAKGAPHFSKHKKAIARKLDRLEAENAELRAKAIDLILQIQVLREGDPDRGPIRLTRSRRR